MENKNEILIVDLETTDLESEFGCIVEVALVLLNLNTGKAYPLFSSLCREEGRTFDTNAWIFVNSDLKTEILEHAPRFQEFIPLLQHYFLHYPVTAFNQAFDFKWLMSRGLVIPDQFFDPMVELTNIMKIPNKFHGYKWPNVTEAFNYFFPRDLKRETHRALGDALMEAKIVFETHKILQSLPEQTEEELLAEFDEEAF